MQSPPRHYLQHLKEIPIGFENNPRLKLKSPFPGSAGLILTIELNVNNRNKLVRKESDSFSF